MDFVEIFKIIGITTGPQIVLIIIIGFWGKKLIEQFFTESIELKKTEMQKSILDFSNTLEIKHSEIKSKIERELKVHQNQLDKWKFEFETKYETKFQKTMDVIEDTYTNLYSFNILLTQVSHFQSANKIRKKV